MGRPPRPPQAKPDGGGTSPEASTENPEASVQRVGGDQSRGIKKPETETLATPEQIFKISSGTFAPPFFEELI